MDGEADDSLAGAIASAVEALRRRRFSEATEDELQAIRDLMGNIVVAVPHRLSRRTRPARRGPITDLRGSVRAAIQTDGELLRRPRRRRKVRPRRLVLILDVSGSMAGYSRALLHFAYAARFNTADVEVFAFGTRLTHLTDELADRDVDRALAAAAERVVDWDGGTLIGRSLATLNRSYGRRGMLRGAVVVICSDGLDRGDPQEIRDEMARTARYAYRLVWVNPLKGDSRYQPLARGMAAALPHLDRFVSGHNLASLDELADILRCL
ncbi:vWA domain-containing protein [Blastococcus brunescens]|uniref:VWA domain-containing protein n=1 Tax=Blastococcus brunescens TaxID=1564165 RepID=A0ABZ1B2L3_9ACTN|nr:VWA domain-containing protein [Blastococcus sp. BMG 8361]WRL63589.1 VWA domain-containing protein [Blastococcus sp. BMG 8361]